jgi:hypothetical protein
MNAAKELTPDEINRLEWLLGTIEAKRLVGEPLTSSETALRDSLMELTAAEEAARTAFASFYSALPSPASAENGTSQVALPGDVATRINRWVEARRLWDEAVTEILHEPPPKLVHPLAPVRTGPRLKATLPALLRIPTAVPARDTLALLFSPSLWKADANGMGVTAQHGETQVRLECDDVLGLGPQEAIRQIAKYGPSVAQTFFALVGLWQERNPGASHETYMTAYASDLLRYQHRKETGKGGYHKDDIVAKGRDLYLLSRISVPGAAMTTFDCGKREAKHLSLGRLLSLEALEMAEFSADNDTNGEGSRTATSVVRFRYHLGREVYEWVGGKDPQYSLLSGKLLTYHPMRQKYQILLGFCLAYYDRASRRMRQEARRLSLPTLLALAAIEVPDKRISEFLSAIEEALNELSRDGVIPGLKLVKPANWPEMLAKRDTRAVIAGSVVTFPCLPVSLPETNQRSLPQ